MFEHPKMVKFNRQMKDMLDAADKFIEDLYGTLYVLHPARPKRGATSNPQADGLFSVGADFTPGFGSKLGRGYIIDVEMKTLEKVPAEKRQEIYEAAVNKIKELLPVYFPERKLDVHREGNHFKIQGDFSLGSI